MSSRRRRRRDHVKRIVQDQVRLVLAGRDMRRAIFAIMRGVGTRFESAEKLLLTALAERKE